MTTLERLRTAWHSSGRTVADFQARLNRPLELHDHEEYLIERAGLTFPTSFFSAAKALIGEHAFDAILADLKNSAIEHEAPQVRSPDGLFVFRVCESLRCTRIHVSSTPLQRAQRRAR